MSDSEPTDTNFNAVVVQREIEHVPQARQMPTYYRPLSDNELYDAFFMLIRS